MPLNPLETGLQYLLTHPERFGEALAQHVWLSTSALIMASLLALPTGMILAHQSRWRHWIIPIFSGLRVLPSLAVLALMIPIIGTGMAPALMALTLLAIPPILINTTLGLSQVNADTIEAAQGLGMSSMEVFNRVAFPLALPAILTGLRTAAVEVVAGATLAALIGGGGFGTFIVNGLSLYNFGLLLVGTIPVAILALLAEIGFGCLERRSKRYEIC